MPDLPSAFYERLSALPKIPRSAHADPTPLARNSPHQPEIEDPGFNPGYFFLSVEPFFLVYFVAAFVAAFFAGFFFVAIRPSNAERACYGLDKVRAGKEDAAVAGPEGQPVTL